MTDAPRRIWAAHSDDAGGAWVPWQIDAPEYTRADLIDMDVLRRVEELIDKMAAAWFVAAQNNKGGYMTLGEIGALAKHHLDVTALRRSEAALVDLRAMMDKINE